VVLILCAAVDVQAQAIVGPSDAIGIDYPEGWFSEYIIDRFEVQYDGEEWTSLGIPPIYASLNGVTTYTVRPARLGSHTASFRVCNAEACSTSTSPFAFVVPTDGTPDVGRLVELHAGHADNKCLDVAGASTENGSAVIQWQCHGGDNQVWSIEPAGDGFSRLVSRNSGKCLDVSGASTDDGAPVLQWQCHSGANQQWRVEAIGAGYRLMARHSGKCLDVPAWSTADGTLLVQWPCNGGANQTWLVYGR
jgi:hypothetical protein